MRFSRGWKIVSTNLFRRVFVWVIKMLQYNRIDVSEGIDINKTGEYVSMMAYELKNIAILNAKVLI